ncbi:hypothetical protein AB0A74_39980 [Saccharothrix sp. NPDC042600]|uniref:hypothetical protein n=1 Tax=Saccharothrix sp. NPDC042600 TaxID=3154492 RepID=UPI00340418C0
MTLAELPGCPPCTAPPCTRATRASETWTSPTSAASKSPFAVTHAPGHMFITVIRDDQYTV